MLANVQTHLRLVYAVAKQAAQVLVFPELSLTGYELDLAAGLAFAESDSRLGPLLDAAVETEMILVVGAPVRLGPRLHVGALALCPNGSILLTTKRHLEMFRPEVNPGGPVLPTESSVLDPGDRSPLLKFGNNMATVRSVRTSSSPLALEQARTVVRRSTWRACSSHPEKSSTTPRC